MKKLILIAFALVGSLCVHSQDEPDYPKNQISLFYGGISPLFIVNLPNNGPEKTDNSGKAIEKKDFHKKIRHYYGIYNVQYMRTITPKLEIGLAANVELFDKIFNSGINKTTSYDKDICYRLLCVGQINLVNKKYARAYAKGGLGVGLFYQYDWYDKSNGETEDRSFVLPCLECIVGAEYGTGFIRPFVEYGCGGQGILAFGLRTRF